MNLKPLPPQDDLLRIFRYEPDTGILYWTVNQGTATAGSAAGSALKSGALHVRINKQFYLVHRVIWKMVTGLDPALGIDHRDVNPSNNRWSNLREAGQADNMANASIQKNNTSGAKGVSLDSRTGRWVAYINRSGRRYHLGSYSTVAEASAARAAAAHKHHGEFARAS